MIEESFYNLDCIIEEPQLTAEYVLGKVDDVLIFRFYLGEFKLGRPIKSPFNLGTRPNFSIIFNDRWMKLMWKCFHSSSSGDCFGLVSKLFNLTYYQAIERVANDFGLIKGVIISKKKLEEAKAFKENFKKEEILIQVKVKKYTKQELDYWKEYTITKEELKENKIFSVESIWVNKKKVFLSDDLRFAYHFPNDKWKIYTPLNKDFKWFGNVSAFEMEGFDTLPYSSKHVIIEKSRKDLILARRIFTDVVSTQNESEFAITPENDAILKEKYEERFVFWDADEQAVNACKKLNSKGYKYLNIPKKIYEITSCKDLSDLVKYYGFEKAKEIVLKVAKNKGIWL